MRSLEEIRKEREAFRRSDKSPQAKGKQPKQSQAEAKRKLQQIARDPKRSQSERDDAIYQLGMREMYRRFLEEFAKDEES